MSLSMGCVSHGDRSFNKEQIMGNAPTVTIGEYTPSEEEKWFAENVNRAAMGSYPELLGSSDAELNTLYASHTNGVIVYANILDHNERGRLVARIRFEIGKLPAGGWSTPEFERHHFHILDSSFTVFKVIDEELGLAELAYVSSEDGGVVTPADTSFETRRRLRSMSTTERQRWLKENPPEFRFPELQD